MKLKTGWKVSLAFSIHLHKSPGRRCAAGTCFARDIILLEKLQNFFKSAGNIQINLDGSITYTVTSIKYLLNIIIPHFEKFPLLTKKQGDFELFKQIVELMKNKEHLTKEGLLKVVSIKASLNKGLSEKLKKSYPEILPVLKPEIKEYENINKNWIAGFVDGEGSFIVSIVKSKTKIGFAVRLAFSIVQNNPLRARERVLGCCAGDYKLISKLVNILNCGSVLVNSNNSGVEFMVNRLSDINEIIIPLFQKYNLISIKNRDFEDFCKIVELMKNKEHLTNEGLEKIILIKSVMNRRRIV